MGGDNHAAQIMILLAVLLLLNPVMGREPATYDPGHSAAQKAAPRRMLNTEMRSRELEDSTTL